MSCNAGMCIVSSDHPGTHRALTNVSDEESPVVLLQPIQISDEQCKVDAPRLFGVLTVILVNTSQPRYIRVQSAVDGTKVSVQTQGQFSIDLLS